MNKEKYLRAGEFAEICDVSKHVLIHYDEIGLFQPAYRSDNGYRYYSYHQYDTFNVIKNLQKMGMSLTEIKDYLERRNPHTFLNLLDQKSHDIDDQIRYLLNTKVMMQRMKDTTSEALLHEHGQIDVVTLSRTALICTDNLVDTTKKTFGTFMRDYIQFIKERHISVQQSVGIIISVNHLRKKEYNNYTYLYQIMHADYEKPSYIREHGDYICGWHHGSYDSIGQTYHKMLRFADEHQISLGTFAYEEYMVTDIAEISMNNYITRIYMEIESSL